MSNLKPLNWSPLNIAETPFRTYTVQADGNGKIVVDYGSKHGEPATGFKTIDDAKKWAFDHYAKEMQPYVELDTSQQIIDWFQKAKPDPTYKDLCVQVGCCFEEIVELIDGLGFKKSDARRYMHELAGLFKAGTFEHEISKLTRDERVDILDALCDIPVTTNGIGYIMGFDMQGALNEVIRSNNSKFEDGKPIFNEQGKIMKGKDYSEPDLTPFLGGCND